MVAGECEDYEFVVSATAACAAVAPPSSHTQGSEGRGSSERREEPGIAAGMVYITLPNILNAYWLMIA